MTSCPDADGAGSGRAGLSCSLPGRSEGAVFSSSHPPSPRAAAMTTNHGAKAAGRPGPDATGPGAPGFGGPGLGGNGELSGFGRSGSGLVTADSRDFQASSNAEAPRAGVWSGSGGAASGSGCPNPDAGKGPSAFSGLDGVCCGAGSALGRSRVNAARHLFHAFARVMFGLPDAS